MAIALGQIDPVLEGKEVVLRREQLEGLLLDLVQRTFITVDRVMREAALGAHDIRSVEDLMYVLNDSKPGETVKVVVLRGGKSVELSATFQESRGR